MVFKILQIAIPFIWFGAIGAISFMEAPLKFTAPNITLALGLGIGRIKTVRGFRIIFTDCIVRCVTVVAGGNRVMTRFLPAVVLLLHYVAIGAISRIIAHI
jgi:hypothetical protein